MRDEDTANVDLQNRHLEQAAQTDTDIETLNPPRTSTGGMTTVLQVVALVAIAVLVVFVLFQSP